MFYIILLTPLTLYFNYTISNYFITLFLLYEIYRLLRNDKNNLTLEDYYQKRINIKNKSNGSLIYVTMSYNNKEFFQYILNNIQTRLCEYNTSYNLEQDYNKIFFNKNNYVFFNKEDFLREENYHYKFFIDKFNMKIYSYIKHEYIGGSYLLKLFYTFINTPQKNIEKLFPKSSIFNVFLALKLLYNYKNIPKIENNEYCKFVNYKSEIKRYRNNYNLIKEQSFSIKTIILYNIMKKIHICLNLKRPLICYLPIAFQNYKNIKNNIGIMWLTFDPNIDTIETIDQKIYFSRYQIPATNAILLYKNNKKDDSIQIRKSVDVVITFMLGTENQSFDVSWTFENISDYPIYVAIASIMKENHFYINETITSSTPNFKIHNEEFQEVHLNDYKL